MSLGDFISSGQIASRSIFFELTNLKSTALSLAVFGLAGQQASGWNTLLTPQFFSRKTAVFGRELNLRSPFLPTSLSNDALDFCVSNASNLAGFTVGQTESGYATLNQDSTFPVSLTFMNFAFNTSTAGILPLIFEEIDVSPCLHDGISATSSMVQQGFSADVTCEFHDLKPDTTPSLIFNNATVKDWTDGTSEPLPITSFNMSSSCVSPDGPALINSTSVDILIGEGSGSLVMLVAMPMPMAAMARSRGIFDGTSNIGIELIFSGSGLYASMKTMVCNLTPIITYVQVDYTYGFSGFTISTSQLSGAVPDAWGLPGLSAVNTIYNMMYFAQGIQTNIVGDQLRTSNFDSMLDATAEYIRGVAEYSGSVFRACISAKNGGISVDGVPENMTIPVQGKFETQFFGWEFTLFSCWVLIPGTFVAFATLYTVYLSFGHHAVDRRTQEFNPGDTMHVVLASAAGGLGGVLVGEAERDKKVHIGVGAVNGREALIEK
ncbi:hypothetical protein B0H19DRAFT_1250504 [Mycena capillaripes]|nr:hypothetical protein B0H19DRAFT_1250504 [Mycena capillaripes]